MHISSMKNFLTHFQRQFTSALPQPVYKIPIHRLRKRTQYHWRELHNFNSSKECGVFCGKHIHVETLDSHTCLSLLWCLSNATCYNMCALVLLEKNHIYSYTHYTHRPNKTTYKSLKTFWMTIGMHVIYIMIEIHLMLCGPSPLELKCSPQKRIRGRWTVQM